MECDDALVFHHHDFHHRHDSTGNRSMKWVGLDRFTVIAAPSCSARSETSWRPRVVALVRSSSRGMPTPLSLTESVTSLFGSLFRSISMLPWLPCGKPCLSALEMSSLTIRPH